MARTTSLLQTLPWRRSPIHQQGIHIITITIKRTPFGSLPLSLSLLTNNIKWQIVLPTTRSRLNWKGKRNSDAVWYGTLTPTLYLDLLSSRSTRFSLISSLCTISCHPQKRSCSNRSSFNVLEDRNTLVVTRRATNEHPSS